MSLTTDQAPQLSAFLAKWQASGAAERANAQLFLNELCGLLGVELPHGTRPDEALNSYVFEKSVPSPTGSTWRIDLYKRGCFVLETKQGTDLDERETFSAEAEERRRKLKTGHGIRGTKGWDVAMQRAKEQGERYARALPKAEVPEGRPPFVVVVDVGHSIALYADWSRMGGDYLPFPDPASYRIPLKDLERPEVRAQLRAVWADPLSLDPGRRSARVTREIADRLARLARSLEGHPGSAAGATPERVANFLLRCLFTMFAEDVALLPPGSFTGLLARLKEDPDAFVPALESLWGTMSTGGLSTILLKKLPRFGGGLFTQADAIPLNADQIQLLIEAAAASWEDVEPAIFGTLLERALDPRERHKLGAHYTPRAYVERLVNPTVMEPLRAEWRNVQVAALQLAEQGQDQQAIAQVEGFLHHLAGVKVLDPACGSGNFLYVTLELLKRLEGEVVNTLHDLGATAKLELEGVMVTPANFHGIELNPRAAAIAEQVLWIGFLQWHLKVHGDLHHIPEPILRDLHNIENRDAVLEYDSKTEQRDADGNVVTRWDGRTTRPHPVTGEEVPDPEARVPVYTYTNPRPAKWPTVDYIVGNPPFIGKGERMRTALGDGYVDTLRRLYPEVPGSADFVMYWWYKAAELIRHRKAKRFGLITTNSITQALNRKLVESQLLNKKPISLVFAIPDHPWVDSSDGAAVRIAMTVGAVGSIVGTLALVNAEDGSEADDASRVRLVLKQGRIQSDLTAGPAVNASQSLRANEELSAMGYLLAGRGFILEKDKARGVLTDNPQSATIVHPLVNGNDVLKVARGSFVIDAFELEEDELLKEHPKVYQHLRDTVYHERQQSREPKLKQLWWRFGRSREMLRSATMGLARFIITPETSKHRIFSFLSSEVRPEHKLVVIASSDAFVLGVLSSSIHLEWALASGGKLEDRPVYAKTMCFEAFPFPTCTPEQQTKIRDLAEQLDAHRKRQQALHPTLTLTGMYNVLEAVRAGEPLSVKDRTVYEDGLVGILKELHDQLDAAVAEAYGWPDLAHCHSGLDPESRNAQILERLVELNAERAAEEARGLVRWLRPEYQAKGEAVPQGTQAELEVDEEAPAPAPAEAQPWPKELPAQAAALTAVLATLTAPASVAEIATCFEGKAAKKRLEEIGRLLETLEALGRATHVQGDRWAAIR